MQNTNHSKTSLQKNSIEALFNFEIDKIQVPNFITEDERTVLFQQIDACGMEFYQNVNPPIGKIGTTVFEHQKIDEKDSYFQKAENAINLLNAKVPLHNQIIGRILSSFRDLGYQTDIAFDKTENKQYFAGLVRLFGGGGALLHIDYAPFDAANYSISENVAQIACNIFVKMPESGGESQVFDKVWDIEDEKMKIPNSYGYNEEIIKENKTTLIKPLNGDLTLFNSRCFHKVHPSSDTRITISCFIGLKPNGSLVIWS